MYVRWDTFESASSLAEGLTAKHLLHTDSTIFVTVSNVALEPGGIGPQRGDQATKHSGSRSMNDSFASLPSLIMRFLLIYIDINI